MKAYACCSVDQAHVLSLLKPCLALEIASASSTSALPKKHLAVCKDWVSLHFGHSNIWMLSPPISSLTTACCWQTTARYEETPILTGDKVAVNQAAYQPPAQMQTPSQMATGYPTGTIPSYGNADYRAGYHAGHQHSQQMCWNADWLYRVLGLLFTPLWCVGACLPLCCRPRLPTTSSKVGWSFNLILSILLLAVAITAVVLVVKNVRDDVNDINSDDNSRIPSGYDTDGSICSLAQQSCSSSADCCSNTAAKAGLICTSDASGAAMCLVEQEFACNENADCVCSSGCEGDYTACSIVPYYTSKVCYRTA